MNKFKIVSNRCENCILIGDLKEDTYIYIYMYVSNRWENCILIGDLKEDIWCNQKNPKYKDMNKKFINWRNSYMSWDNFTTMWLEVPSIYPKNKI